MLLLQGIAIQYGRNSLYRSRMTDFPTLISTFCRSSPPHIHAIPPHHLSSSCYTRSKRLCLPPSASGSELGSMFPISFNSFGDIICAADLALRIAKALSSSSGSSYEYQYLIQELNALAYALHLADAATRTGMLDRAVVNGILAEIARCQEVMDRLWERIRGYQKALGATGSSRGSSWRKIGWSLFKTKDVKETRERLATQRLNLTTLMTACSMYGACISPGAHAHADPVP